MKSQKGYRGQRQRVGNVFIFGILKNKQQKQWNKKNVLKYNLGDFFFLQNRETLSLHFVPEKTDQNNQLYDVYQ